MRSLKRGLRPAHVWGLLIDLVPIYEAHIKKLPAFIAPQTVARHVLQTLDQLDVKETGPGTSAGPESIALRGSMAVYGYQRRWGQRVANSTIIAIRVILQCLTCEHLVRNLVACIKVPTYHNTHAGIASHTPACSLKHRGWSNPPPRLQRASLRQMHKRRVDLAGFQLRLSNSANGLVNMQAIQDFHP